jgi:hypothetical protein
MTLVRSPLVMLSGSLAGNHFVVVASAFSILDRNLKNRKKRRVPALSSAFISLSASSD